MRALRVREVSVKEFHEVGSHALFLTTVERDTIPGGAKSLHLFHTFESYRRYLSVTKRSVHGGAVDAPARYRNAVFSKQEPTHEYRNLA